MKKGIRYAAFLRAINVGNRTVKMDALRKAFESLGYSNVETFIASGNVVFESPSADAGALEKAIEAKLLKTFGFEVHTFLRRCDELAAIAGREPFPRKAMEASRALIIGFLTGPLDAAAKKKVMALKSDVDDFHLDGRELYWLAKVGQGQSEFSNAVFEKVTGCRSTFRSVTTVRKMSAKFGNVRS